MKHASTRIASALALLSLAACTAPPVNQRAGVLDYLYPGGVPVTPPSDVHLTLPLRVGVAFAPTASVSGGGPGPWDFAVPYEPVFDASAKRALLERIADSFRATPGVAAIELVPEAYLRPAGGFENVDQLRGLLGIDLLAVVSYDQTQIQDLDRSSLAYWTLVGAYFVEGNENETHTFVDVSVFDIPSRALLFNAGGRSRIEHESTALESNEVLRRDSRRGFESAVDGALGELQTALASFREQAKSGTVRGAGTPKVQVSGEGAGACGALEAGLAIALLVGWRRGRRTVARG